MSTTTPQVMNMIQIEFYPCIYDTNHYRSYYRYQNVRTYY